MNQEKFTDKAQQMLIDAQNIALNFSHQKISVEHLLQAMLQDEDRLVEKIIALCDGNIKMLQLEISDLYSEHFKSFTLSRTSISLPSILFI